MAMNEITAPIGPIDGDKLKVFIEFTFQKEGQTSSYTLAAIRDCLDRGEFSLPSPSPNESRYREALLEQKRWLDAIWATFTGIKIYGLDDKERLSDQCEGGQDQCTKAIKEILEALSDRLQIVDGQPVRERRIDECQYGYSDRQCLKSKGWHESEKDWVDHDFVPKEPQ